MENQQFIILDGHTQRIQNPLQILALVLLLILEVVTISVNL
jgi:hypothetical protein